ncbi:ribonuclease H-like domain-containing protein [Tanacetum coccineum]|uniref:Ribonuclease H-like domain-containing protein n=1 Tax=Tanacetum coccineum TaxID=301880 RepID=A0ABQ5H7L2_9ASTR
MKLGNWISTPYYAANTECGLEIQGGTYSRVGGRGARRTLGGYKLHFRDTRGCVTTDWVEGVLVGIRGGIRFVDEVRARVHEDAESCVSVGAISLSLTERDSILDMTDITHGVISLECSLKRGGGYGRCVVVMALSVDFDKTFSPVVKPATIRMVLSLAVSRSLTMFVVCRDLYMGTPLKQAPGAWYLRLLYLFYNVEILFLRLRSTALLINYNLFFTSSLECLTMYIVTPSRTPVDTKSKLGPDGVPVQDPTMYRSLAGGLQYLTFTRPDLSYAVQQIFLYMHDPREPHLAALKRILRYVQGTLDLGLHLYASSTTSLVGYTDVDWAGCPSTRRSTSGYYVFLGDNLLSWSAKRQHTLSCSSAEAEYRGVANVVAETA